MLNTDFFSCILARVINETCLCFSAVGDGTHLHFLPVNFGQLWIPARTSADTFIILLDWKLSLSQSLSVSDKKNLLRCKSRQNKQWHDRFHNSTMTKRLWFIRICSKSVIAGGSGMDFCSEMRKEQSYLHSLHPSQVIRIAVKSFRSIWFRFYHHSLYQIFHYSLSEPVIDLLTPPVLLPLHIDLFVGDVYRTFRCMFTFLSFNHQERSISEQYLTRQC